MWDYSKGSKHGDDEVMRYARDCAEWVANEITEDTDSGTVYELADRRCEEYLDNRGRALQVIGRYGWADALRGGVDYGDSPLYLFEKDVYEIAFEMLEEQGIKVD